MPYLNLKTNLKLDKSTTNELMNELNLFVSKGLDKPEKYIMCRVEDDQYMLFGNSIDATMLIELRSIRLPEKETPKLSASLSNLIKDNLNIPKDRIFINFMNIEPHLWGYNGSTF